MNCQEVLECMTAGVDGTLAAEVLPQFRQHIAECPRCRFEYEFEIATKSIVRNRLPRVAAPLALRNEISRAIASRTILTIIFSNDTGFPYPSDASNVVCLRYRSRNYCRSVFCITLKKYIIRTRSRSMET